MRKVELIDFSNITRLEVINETGRVLSWWNISIVPSMQDDGRTLKLFIKPLQKEEKHI